MRTPLLVLLLSVFVVGSALADDLYLVEVTNSAAADALRQTNLRPILRVTDGYLLLLTAASRATLEPAGLDYRYVAGDLTRNDLVVDMRHDDANRARYDLVYEDSGTRLYRFSTEALRQSTEPLGLTALPELGVPVVFSQPPPLRTAELEIDLDSAIATVSADSLSFVSHYLEDHFLYREAGTITNSLARTWFYTRFHTLGYDSVVIQDFVADLGGENKHCQNVLAIKLGSELPLNYIVVGAHRDAGVLSPGGDDNGSGSVAVMEMARLLANYDNRMTLVFALFDAEEWGLYGSWHYANMAAARGDSITMMMNLDMVAHIDNDADVNSFYGSTSDIWALLWGQLADSLTGIDLTAHYNYVNGGSDHMPFHQNGYNVVYLAEYEFSTHYHQPSDSTTYMNFDYLSRVTKGCLATILTVDGTYETTPRPVFEIDGGMPTMIYPEMEQSLTLSVQNYGDYEMDPSSLELHWSTNDTDWISEPATAVGPDLYQIPLPHLSCGEHATAYFSVTNLAGDSCFYPYDSSRLPIAIGTELTTLFHDNFDEDRGWSVSGDATDGQWERGSPIRNYYGGAPLSDVDGSDKIFQTGMSPVSDVDEGHTYLTSPVIDIDGKDALVSYARWYSNSTTTAPHEDILIVSLLNGSYWWPVETVGPVSQADGDWYERSFWISQIFPPPQSVQIRFDASDLGEDSNVEAGVDAFYVRQYGCPPIVVTESLPDWTVTAPINFHVLTAGGSGELTCTDKLGELVGTGMSITPEGWLTGTPTATGTIGFNFYVVDEEMENDQRWFEFDINPMPQITTATIPDGVQGVPYEEILTAVDGTPPLTWSDADGGLTGSGLTIDSTGSIEGTPVDTGTYSFTLRVTDAAGAIDDLPLALHVSPDFICGDINNDGIGPDIADLVYLVTYMFQDGPPPPIMETTDLDSSGAGPDIADLVYLVAYMFQNGPGLCP